MAFARANGPISGSLGRALVHGMPPFLAALSFIGMLAMLWVGGGILFMVWLTKASVGRST